MVGLNENSGGVLCCSTSAGEYSGRSLNTQVTCIVSWNGQPLGDSVFYYFQAGRLQFSTQENDGLGAKPIHNLFAVPCEKRRLPLSRGNASDKEYRPACSGRKRADSKASGTGWPSSYRQSPGHYPSSLVILTDSLRSFPSTSNVNVSASDR